jgi:Holliday junction DNA helicase RuvA
MFNSIEGIVAGKEDGTLFIKTGGIEWEIALSLRDIADIPDEGGSARVWTWLSHRETEMKLFGFASVESRAIFLELIKVEGIGAKAAQKIMGGIPFTDLASAIENDDLGRLQAVPGLGKKMAQKMLLALKGKVFAAPAGHERHINANTPYNELEEALVQMGYDRKAVERALEIAEKEIPRGTEKHEKESLLFSKAILHLST